MLVLYFIDNLKTKQNENLKNPKTYMAIIL